MSDDDDPFDDLELDALERALDRELAEERTESKRGRAAKEKSPAE
jgi:hypothetical protein